MTVKEKNNKILSDEDRLIGKTTRPVRLFNIDLHISVIADIKYILQDLYGDRVEIVDWPIGGYRWVFEREAKEVKFINRQSWKNFNQEMMDNFLKEYSAFLSQFDGFIVTHSPVFSLLFEKFNKPVILINSTRYEQPFSFNENNDIKSWNSLNLTLKRMYDAGQLIAVSNNRADQAYLKLGTGIDSILIPSLCYYTNAEYNPGSDLYVIFTDCPFNRKTAKMISKDEFAGSRYSWEVLYSCKGIVHYPYEVSTMSLFEQYSANVPLFFPTKRYLKEMISSDDYFFGTRYIMFDPEAGLKKLYPPELSIAIEDPAWVDFWVDKADYYDENNMRHIVHFDNESHLEYLIDTTNCRELSEKMKTFNSIRKKQVYRSWVEIMEYYFY